MVEDAHVRPMLAVKPFVKVPQRQLVSAPSFREFPHLKRVHDQTGMKSTNYYEDISDDDVQCKEESLRICSSSPSPRSTVKRKGKVLMRDWLLDQLEKNTVCNCEICLHELKLIFNDSSSSDKLCFTKEKGAYLIERV